jgi:hypothetical protein
MSPELTLKALLGKTLISVEGAKEGSNEVIFDTKTERFRMYHQQDCCESVAITRVRGDVSKILNSPVTRAVEKSPDYKYEGESGTWSEFQIFTKKGSLTILWLGESNGYYSESVSFDKL